jgi:DNA invertase Pin-like site-specific DNA recombinase
MKAAIYARYSSDKQRETSIEDQNRRCREYARRQGWDIVLDSRKRARPQ